MLEALLNLWECTCPAVTEMEGFNSHLNMEQMNKVGGQAGWLMLAGSG